MTKGLPFGVAFLPVGISASGCSVSEGMPSGVALLPKSKTAVAAVASLRASPGTQQTFKSLRLQAALPEAFLPVKLLKQRVPLASQWMSPISPSILKVLHDATQLAIFISQTLDKDVDNTHAAALVS